MKGKICLSPVLAACLLWGAFCATLPAETPGRDGELVISVIEPGDLTDLIGINGGLEQELVPGMVLSVFNNGRRVGELLLTRVEEKCAVALIAALEPEKTLAIGDKATAKLRKFKPI